MRSELEQSYRNTVYCAETLKQEAGRVTTQYCGNRWCMVCNRIRTARAINRYMPVLDRWEETHLVTLTIRNVGGGELPAAIGAMLAAFSAIKLALRRTHKTKLVALRKLECTYNVLTGEFHPHFHVVVQGGAAAELLRTLWLDRNAAITDPKGQDVRACTRDSLREVFKYFTKLLAKTREKGTSRPVPPAALDVIFRAMRGRRVYQPVGFVCDQELPDEGADELTAEEGTPAFTRVAEEVTWRWVQRASDWVDPDTGECLTGYEPSEKFRELVESIPGPKESAGLLE